MNNYTTKKIKELSPGDVFDIQPVLEAVGIDPDPLHLEELFGVEEAWQEQPGVTIVCSSSTGCWALPSEHDALVWNGD